MLLEYLKTQWNEVCVASPAESEALLSLIVFLFPQTPLKNVKGPHLITYDRPSFPQSIEFSRYWERSFSAYLKPEEVPDLTIIEAYKAWINSNDSAAMINLIQSSQAYAIAWRHVIRYLPDLDKPIFREFCIDFHQSFCTIYPQAAYFQSPACKATLIVTLHRTGDYEACLSLFIALVKVAAKHSIDLVSEIWVVFRDHFNDKDRSKLKDLHSNLISTLKDTIVTPNDLLSIRSWNLIDSTLSDLVVDPLNKSLENSSVLEWEWFFELLSYCIVQRDYAICLMSLPLIRSNRSSSIYAIDKNRADKFFGTRALEVIAVLLEHAAESLSVDVDILETPHYDP